MTTRTRTCYVLFYFTAPILVLLSRTFPFGRLLRLSRYHSVVVLLMWEKINLLVQTEINAGPPLNAPGVFFNCFDTALNTRPAFNRGPVFLAGVSITSVWCLDHYTICDTYVLHVPFIESAGFHCFIG